MSPQMAAFYVGPDQMMPVASLLATIAGVALIFWNKLLNLLRRLGHIFRPPAGKPDVGGTVDAERRPPRQT